MKLVSILSKVQSIETKVSLYGFVGFINALILINYHNHTFPSATAKPKDGLQEHTKTYDSHLVAALGINWAHAVTIRLVLEAKSGKVSPFQAFVRSQ